MDNQEAQYLNSLSSFSIMLNELGNYVVLNDIKTVLNRLNVEDIRNGFYEQFLQIVTSNEIKRSLELLSDSSKNYMNSSKNIIECSQMILNDLHGIGLKEIETIEKWDELSLLFGLSNVRKLDINIVNAIILDINTENTEALRDKFNTFLNTDIPFIDAELESHNTDIITLASEVIENRPKLKYCFSENFEKHESYFIDKIINLNQDEHETYKGSVKKCKRRGDNLKFYTHNKNIYKINKRREFQLIEVTIKSLFYALEHSLIEGSKFRIEINPKYSGSESSKLEVDNYIVASRICKESKQYKIFGELVKVFTFIISGSKYTYSISAKMTKEKIQEISITSTRVSDNIKFKIYKNKLFDSIKTVFNAVYKNPVYRTVFSSEHELTRLLQVTENKDEANNRLIQATNINQMIDKLRTELIKSDNRKLLESFLNNLVLNKLQFIDKNFLQTNTFVFKRSFEICENYRKYLDKFIEPNHLIKEIVIDANYILYIEKEQSLEISKTMELLKDAYKHIDKLRGKKIVFFLGNTGSGKSTTVSYLLGANLKQLINKVGDRVFEIDHGTSNKQGELPKIGQSLGESETIYTQGYLIDQSQDVYLADCPGFNDTRGGHYELCSNLSIDQVIKNSERICSLVIVLPIQSFIIDRGNHIIEFVDDLNERFENVFSREFDKSSLFIIITKSNQVNNEVARKMKDGTRFSELRRECQEKYNKLAGETEIDLLGIKSMKKRLDIWTIFYELNNQKQIEFIDVLNKGKKRNDLISKITSLGRTFDKSCYAPLMESSDMKQKFGKSIELSVHTFRKLIIDKFLIEYPQKKIEILFLLNEVKQKIICLQNEKANRENTIAEKKIQLTENELNINNFENAKNNPDTLTPELLSKLEQDANQSENEIYASMGIEIKRLQRDEREAVIDIDSYNNTIKELINESESFKTEKENCQRIINKLEEGYHTEVLFEQRNNPDEYLTIRTIRSQEIIERAFWENRDYADDEITKTQRIKYSEFRGILYRTVIIERDYMLVPKDPKDREFFQNLRLSGNATSLKGFTAILESNKYEPDYKSSIEPSGKKIRYLFNVKYDSGSLPWIKITFTIPNKIYHEAQIINKTAEISDIDSKLLEIKKKIDRKTNDIKECKELQIKIRKEISDKERRLHKYKQDVELENQKKSIEKYITKIKEMAEYLISEIKILEDFTELNKNLSDKEIELNKKETELEDNNKKFRDLSIIILTQLETADMLRKLSSLIADNNHSHSDQVSAESKSKSSMKESVIFECVEYISSYDKNIKKIEEECKRILNLVN